MCYIKQKQRKEIAEDYGIPTNAVKCTNCGYYNDYDDTCEKWDCELSEDPGDCCCRDFQPDNR